MSTRVIIFDFDGTIADTHKHTVDIFNSFADEFKYKKIPWENIEVYKKYSMTQMIRKLHVPVLKIPTIISRGKRKYNQLIPFMVPIEGVREALLTLRQQSVTLGILSSNSKENIMLFLENNNMLVFDFVYSTSRLTSKNTALIKLIQEEKLEKQNIVYVGDEIRDITAAKKIPVSTAAVTWGFNSAKSLQKNKPDFLLNTPAEMINLINPAPVKRKREWLEKLKPQFARKLIDKLKTRQKKTKE